MIILVDIFVVRAAVCFFFSFSIENYNRNLKSSFEGKDYSIKR